MMKELLIFVAIALISTVDSQSEKKALKKIYSIVKKNNQLLMDNANGGAFSSDILGNAVYQILNHECNSDCAPAMQCDVDQSTSDCPAISDCETCISDHVKKSSDCGWLCKGNIAFAAGICAPSALIFPPGVAWVPCMFGWVKKDCQPCMCSAVEKLSNKAAAYCRAISDNCGGCGNTLVLSSLKCLPKIGLNPEKPDVEEFAKCVIEKVGTSNECKHCICSAFCASSESVCKAIKKLIPDSC